MGHARQEGGRLIAVLRGFMVPAPGAYNKSTFIFTNNHDLRERRKKAA